jgi:3D (Asp-Asp-Asp) domain-containing protein
MILLVAATVMLTTYTLDPKENGKNCDKFACGYHLANESKVGKIIAVSRDLLKQFPFHSLVRIKNSGRFDGIYSVEDLMNKRYQKRIDVLVGSKRILYKLKGVTIETYFENKQKQQPWQLKNEQLKKLYLR